jgi:hypothetical protein
LFFIFVRKARAEPLFGKTLTKNPAANAGLQDIAVTSFKAKTPAAPRGDTGVVLKPERLKKSEPSNYSARLY